MSALVEIPDRDAIEAIASREVQNAIAFYEATLQPQALAALEYINGKMADLPAPEGRSAYVSRDVKDAIGFIMPGLMRIFAGNGDVVRCEARTEAAQEIATQQTAKLNYEWKSRVDGYEVIWSACHDALAFRNGVIKVWWEKDEDSEAGEASGLTEGQVAVLQADPMMQIVSADQTDILPPTPETGGQPVPLYTVRFRRLKSRGRLRVVAVPREEFLISSEARTIERARFVGHRRIISRSELIEMGYGPDDVADLPVATTIDVDILAVERLGGDTVRPMDDALTAENEAVEYVEGYLRLDMNGDGVAERIKVCVAGGNGSFRLLCEPEEVEDDPPFVDIRAIIKPHAWEGVSIADETMEIQRTKSALMRAAFDNVYHTVNPQREVLENAIIDPDEMLSQAIGQIVRVKQPNAVRDMVVPFVGDAALTMVGVLDQVMQGRTGAGKEAAALDGEALKPETAMAAMIRQDVSYAKLELIARNVAYGLRKVFVKMLKIVTAHQDWPETLRLRGQAVMVDPRAWTAECDVVIEIGLGTGSRERDIAMLQAVGAEQDKIIASLGAGNPVVPVSKYVKTRQKMVEVAGGVSPEQYFADVDEEALQQYLASKAQAEQDAQNAPLNNMIAVEQLKADTTLRKDAANAELKQQEINSRERLEAAKVESHERLETMRMKLDAHTKVLVAEIGAKKDLVIKDAEFQRAQEAAQMTMEQALGSEQPAQF